MRQLNFDALFTKMPRLTHACTELRGEAAVVCFDDQGHPTRCHLEVDGDFQESFRVTRPEATAEMQASHNDKVKAVEHGAEGIAFLLTLKLTPYRVVKQSRRGNAHDWWLAPRGGNLFQDAARLECSGILAGSLGELKTRTNEKVERAKSANPTLPTYVCVTNFKYARAKVILL